MKKNSIVFGITLCLFNGVYAQRITVNEAVTTEYAVNARVTGAVSIQADIQDSASDDVLSKNFSKTFAADRTDKINLNNQFGTMVIKVWDRKEVKIDIGITVNSSNKKEAEQLINEVSISAGKTGDLISCKTNIGRGGRNRNRRSEVKISYVVYVPAANPLTLSQQFGNVTIGDFSGTLSANVQYGNFNAGNLSGTNQISVQYGRTNIEEMNRATVKQQYGSGLVIGTAGTLDLDAQYVGVRITNIKGDAIIRQQYGSGLTVGSVNNLNLDVQYASVNVSNIKGNATIKQQYNSIKIGSVGKISVRSEYAGVTIGALRGDGNFHMSYNNLNIGEISQACRNLTIDTEYVDTSLKFGQGYNGDFSVRKMYGSFNSGSYTRTRSSGESGSDKSYAGKIGSGGGASVNIRSEYGSVTLK
jgi:hypothetical protein